MGADDLFLNFMDVPNSLGLAALVAGSDDDDLDSLEEVAAGKLANAGEEAASGIQARLDDLRNLRAAGREAAQARVETAQAAANRPAGSLIAWIQTPDWGASEQYLTDHADDLLSDDGETALDLLQLANPGNEQIPMHRQLLHFAREQGIEAAYVQLRQELGELRELRELGELEQETARALAENPLLRAVVEFLQAGDEQRARQVLDEQRTLLLTADARNLLEHWLQQARQAGDAAAVWRVLQDLVRA